MTDSLFVRCNKRTTEKYLSFPRLEREYQATLVGGPEYCAVDFETTGFDPERDRVIEVGAVKVRDGREVGRIDSLIDPGRSIPAFVRQLTGIDEDAVSGQPSMEEYFGELSGFLGDSTVIAYSRLEQGFLGATYEKIGKGRFRNDYIDVMDLAIMLLPSLRGHRQADLASLWGLESGRQHRALDDALTLVSAFEVLLNGLYNVPLPVLKAVADCAPEGERGLGGLLKRVKGERSGGRPIESLRLDRMAARDGTWEKSPPLEGGTSPVPVTREEVRRFFREDGPLARQFGDYEERDEQLQMAELVRECFEEHKILLVEAGTGTGKSLAYLCPAVLRSRATQSPVVVSTRTLNLQDQLSTRDLPLLERAMGEGSFRFSVLKGYRNYLCLRKLQGLVGGRRRLAERQLGILGMLLNWISENETGDVSLLNVSHLRGLDDLVLANHRECPGPRCPFARSGDCFYRRALYRAKRSNIVVVNHSLLLSGVNLPYRTAVVDEAHTLEDVATDQYTVEFSYRDTWRFLDSLFSPAGGSGFLSDYRSGVEGCLKTGGEDAVFHQVEEAQEAVEICMEELERVFISLSEFHRGTHRKSDDLRFGRGLTDSMEYTRLEHEADKLSAALDRLVMRLERLKAESVERGDESDNLEYLTVDLEGKAVRAAELSTALELFFDGTGEELVRWATVAGPDNVERQCLRVSPIDVAEYLAEFLYDRLDALVMTSATLAVKDDFEFFNSRVGLGVAYGREPEEVILDSSFDFRRQMQLLIMHDMPDPTSGEYVENMAGVLEQVITAAGGGVLVLFTNKRLMLDTYEKMVESLRNQGHNLLCQQPGYSRRRLAEEFVEDESASLFGTTSFWEGVDARGTTLRLVVITRIPFESPGRPVFEARSEKVKLEGGSDFMDLSLPLAALKLKQGVGRLIRTRRDRGQVLILDSRINTMRYGPILLRALPDGIRRKISCGEVSKAISGFLDRS